jgi:hypothetical protein
MSSHTTGEIIFHPNPGQTEMFPCEVLSHSVSHANDTSKAWYCVKIPNTTPDFFVDASRNDLDAKVVTVHASELVKTKNVDQAFQEAETKRVAALQLSWRVKGGGIPDSSNVATVASRAATLLSAGIKPNGEEKNVRLHLSAGKAASVKGNMRIADDGKAANASTSLEVKGSLPFATSKETVVVSCNTIETIKNPFEQMPGVKNKELLDNDDPEAWEPWFHGVLSAEAASILLHDETSVETEHNERNFLICTDPNAAELRVRMVKEGKVTSKEQVVFVLHYYGQDTRQAKKSIHSANIVASNRNFQVDSSVLPPHPVFVSLPDLVEFYQKKAINATRKIVSSSSGVSIAFGKTGTLLSTSFCAVGEETKRSRRLYHGLSDKDLRAELFAGLKSRFISLEMVKGDKLQSQWLQREMDLLTAKSGFFIDDYDLAFQVDEMRLYTEDHAKLTVLDMLRILTKSSLAESRSVEKLTETQQQQPFLDSIFGQSSGADSTLKSQLRKIRTLETVFSELITHAKNGMLQIPISDTSTQVELAKVEQYAKAKQLPSSVLKLAIAAVEEYNAVGRLPGREGDSVVMSLTTYVQKLIDEEVEPLRTKILNKLLTISIGSGHFYPLPPKSRSHMNVVVGSYQYPRLESFETPQDFFDSLLAGLDARCTSSVAELGFTYNFAKQWLKDVKVDFLSLGFSPEHFLKVLAHEREFAYFVGDCESDASADYLSAGNFRLKVGDKVDVQINGWPKPYKGIIFKVTGSTYSVQCDEGMTADAVKAEDITFNHEKVLFEKVRWLLLWELLVNRPDDDAVIGTPHVQWSSEAWFDPSPWIYDAIVLDNPKTAREVGAGGLTAQSIDGVDERLLVRLKLVIAQTSRVYITDLTLDKLHPCLSTKFGHRLQVRTHGVGTVLTGGESKSTLRIDNSTNVITINNHVNNATPATQYCYAAGQKLLLHLSPQSGGHSEWCDAIVVQYLESMKVHKVRISDGTEHKLNLNDFNHTPTVFDSLGKFVGERQRYSEMMVENLQFAVDAITGKSLDVEKQLVSINVNKKGTKGLFREGWSDVTEVLTLAPRLAEPSPQRSVGIHSVQPILISATAGSGKSWCVHQLAHTLAKTTAPAPEPEAPECEAKLVPISEMQIPVSLEAEEETYQQVPEGLPIIIPVQKLARILRKREKEKEKETSKEEPDNLIVEYIKSEYAGKDLECCKMLLQCIRMRTCVILLDGVDEAAEERTRIEALVLDELVPYQIRFVVTSRPEGINIQSYRDKFVIFDLAQLSPEQIEKCLKQQLVSSVVPPMPLHLCCSAIQSNLWFHSYPVTLGWRRVPRTSAGSR